MEEDRLLRTIPKGEWNEEGNGQGMDMQLLTEDETTEALETSRYRASMEQAIAALERAETIAEIKTLHDQAKGIHAFAVLRKDGFRLQQAAAALRIKAEHKAGGILFKIERERGKRTDTDGSLTRYQHILEDEKIGETAALRWQKLAMINENVLQEYLAKMLAAGTEITTADVLRLIDTAPEREKKEKFPGKMLKVMLLDATEMDMEEQESLIWDAIYRAYLITKKQPLGPEIRESRVILAYWLAQICAEYLADNPIEES